MRALVLYWSAGGNTAKVAGAIAEALEGADVDTTLLPTTDAAEVDFYAYDLVCLGCPSYSYHPPEPVVKFMLAKRREYADQGRVKLAAPAVPGKYALTFCTYSGPHTGVREAIPVTLYLGQHFEHLGFAVVDELHVVGEMHGSEETNTLGRLGDIRGRPNERDLEEVRQRVGGLLRALGGA